MEHSNNAQALLDAVSNGDATVVARLLACGATNSKALHCAAENGHAKIVALLLDHSMDVHANNDEALRCAAQNGRAEVVALLLDRGANVHAGHDEALRAAAQNGHPEVVALLLRRNADGWSLTPAQRMSFHVTGPCEFCATDALVSRAWSAIVQLLQKMVGAINASRASCTAAAVFTVAEHSAIYTTVYRMCSRDDENSFHIYRCYINWLFEHLHTHVIPALEAAARGGLPALFAELCMHWQTHMLVVCKFGEQMLRYVERLCARPLRAAGMAVFREVIFERSAPVLMDGVLSAIAAGRSGVAIDRTSLRSAVEVFVEMGTGLENPLEAYRPLENAILSMTASDCACMRVQWLAECDVDTYLQRVAARLHDDETLANQCLHRSTVPVLVELLETELLHEPLTDLLERPGTGFRALLGQYAFEPSDTSVVLRCVLPDCLERVNELLHRIAEGRTALSRVLSEHIVNEGRGLVAACLGEAAGFNQTAFVERLLAMQHAYQALLHAAFHNNVTLHAATKRAFEAFLNEEMRVAGERVLVAEMLAQYIDVVLRGGRDKRVGDLEDPSGAVAMLLTHVQDKDVFQQTYEDLLGKRLLDRVVDEEREHEFLRELKIRIGTNLTHRSEGMVRDRRLSQEIADKFGAWLQQQQQSSAVQPFSALVLTSGFWPQMPVDRLFVPEEVAASFGLFQTFYAQTTHNRVLSWIHASSSAVLHGYFACGKRELSMTAYQAAICMLFNTHERLTLREISEATGITLDEARRAAAGLALGKLKILAVADRPDAKKFEPTDTLVFHEALAVRQTKLRVPLPKLVVKRTASGVTENTEEQRKFALDAAIVRVMKARRVLAHNQLLIEVLEQLKQFRPTPRALKTRVEDLIERDFLRRDATDHTLYQLRIRAS